MYNASISIENIDGQSFKVLDLSEGDEIITDRLITITTAKGVQKFYTFNSFENEIQIDDFYADIALEISLLSTPSVENETSTYSDCIVYAFVNNIEEFILSKNAKIFCNKDCKNDDLMEALDISYNFDGILRFAECKDLYKTQRLIDYINSYMPNRKSNCCTSKQKCETC